jgi:hypothetical protein
VHATLYQSHFEHVDEEVVGRLLSVVRRLSMVVGKNCNGHCREMASNVERWADNDQRLATNDFSPFSDIYNERRFVQSV